MMSSSPDDSPHLSLIKAVELARAGNSEAFTPLFEYYKDGIYGYVVGLVRDVENAYDLTQEVFLRAWEKLPTLHDASKFKPWLYTIARNLVYDYWRRQRKRIWESWEEIGERDIFESGFHLEEQTAEAELVRLALVEVPVRERSCFLLQVEGGFSQYEIAELLGISKASVSTYLSGARKRLRQAYLRLADKQGTTGKRRTVHEKPGGHSL